MATPIYNTSKTVSYTITDGTVNNELDIGLVGDGYLGYGPIVHTNFIKLLENFSNNTPPSKPVRGQLWYDSAEKKLKVFDGGLFANIYTLPNNISVQNLNVDDTAIIANVNAARMYTVTGLYWKGNGAPYTTAARPAGADQQIQFNSAGILTGAFGVTTNGDNLTVSGKTTMGNAAVSTLYTSSGIFWANGDAYGNFVQAGGNPGGPVASLQFNSDGQSLGGSSALTTDGSNLYVTGILSAGGVRYPANLGNYGQYLMTNGDGTTEWADAAGGTVSGQGSTTQLAIFNGPSSVSGAQFITSNGSDLTMAQGTFYAKRMVLQGAGGSITFPDGSIQTSAAVAPPAGIAGSGTSTQLAFFNGTNTLTGAGQIHTNGSDLTVNGVLTAAGKMTIVGTPTNGTDGVNKAYLDSLMNTFATRTYVDGVTQKQVNGYVKFSNGIIIQWGLGITSNTNPSGNPVTFPTAFPGACTSVVACEANASGWNQSGTNHPTVYGVSSANVTGFRLMGSRISGSSSPLEAGLGYFWMAIGF